jgi:hypothetical protein
MRRMLSAPAGVKPSGRQDYGYLADGGNHVGDTKDYIARHGPLPTLPV